MTPTPKSSSSKDAATPATSEQAKTPVSSKAADAPQHPLLRTHPARVLLYLVFVLVVGAISGAFVWVFFLVMNTGIDLLWTALPTALGSPWFYSLIVCIIGGVVIGLWERRVGPLPPSLHEVMASVKRDNRYPYDKLGISSVSAILPLLFGGSVGPEAGLTGAIAGLCTWVGDRMKLAKGELEALTSVGLSATLGAVFNAPLFAFVAPMEGDGEGEPAVVFPGRTKLMLNITAICGAVGAFMGLGALFGGSDGLYRFTAIEVGGTEFAWAIPLAVAGALLGLLYNAADAGTSRLGYALRHTPVVRAVITGALLGAVGCVLPYTMFAGESQMAPVVAGYTGMAAGVLLATGTVKLIMGPLCFNGGWRGGNIFPVIFAGVAFGLGCSLLTGADAAFCCAVICGALCGGVMRKPLTVIMLLVLCFPVKALVFVGLAACLGSVVPIPKWMRKSDPADESAKAA